MATFLIGQPGPHFKPAASAGTDGARSRIRARLIRLVTLTGRVSPTFPAPELSDGRVQERPFVGPLAVDPQSASDVATESAASSCNGSTTAPSPGRPSSLIWGCFAPRGHSRKRRNAIGTPRAIDRSVHDFHLHVRLRRVARAAIVGDRLPCGHLLAWRREWSRPQMHQSNEYVLVTLRDDQVVAGDRTHSLPGGAPAGPTHMAPGSAGTAAPRDRNRHMHVDGGVRIGRP
jgi:hypothetical protein